MTKDDLPPLPRSPVQSWMIDDDGAQHPCLVAPTFSTEELQAYALAAIAAHDAKREKVLLVRGKGERRWDVALTCEVNGERFSDNEYAWAYIEREGA